MKKLLTLGALVGAAFATPVSAVVVTYDFTAADLDAGAANGGNGNGMDFDGFVDEVENGFRFSASNIFDTSNVDGDFVFFGNNNPGPVNTDAQIFDSANQVVPFRLQSLDARAPATTSLQVVGLLNGIAQFTIPVASSQTFAAVANPNTDVIDTLRFVSSETMGNTFSIRVDNVVVDTVPEPASALFLTLGAVAAVGARRRK